MSASYQEAVKMFNHNKARLGHPGHKIKGEAPENFLKSAWL